ncbi:putative gustatory receptor 28b [Belonocnema kinseyi]|uniref:putative gustatory receptor 28b n=1 Tax=Belonocnema kinseyi TaxID=2817044 RepID=UPI00143D5D00|nr:putative gustatory receptor 28b [Belonocnema kinseyi]
MIYQGIKKLKIFKNFRVKDITSLLQPCFFLCRIFGLFPYNIVTAEVSFSKPWYIFSSIFMSINVGCGIFLFYQSHVSKVLAFNSVPGMLQGNCYFIMCTVVGLTTFFLSVSRVSFLQDLLKISANISSESLKKIGIFVYMKDILGFIFLIGQIPNLYDKNVYIVLLKAFGLICTLVIFLTDMLYMDCVTVLYICFENININLLELKNNILTEESQLWMRFFHERKNPILLLKLRTIKKMHHALSDVMEKLNSTFSFQIGASVTLTFAEVTFSLYFYLLHNQNEKKIDLERQIWYSYFLTSITFYCTKLVGIIWICQMTKDEAIRTGSLVHEILINTEETLFKEELQLFSLQILHRDNILTAQGISLDARLITTIVGGITTYLLILIQFLISAKTPCED